MKKAFVFILLMVIVVLSASPVQAGTGVWTSYGPDVGKNVTALATDQTKTPIMIYAGTSEGVFRITQGQSSWSLFSDGLTNTDVRALAIDQTTATSSIYAGTSGGIFKTPSEGGNWSQFVAEKIIYALVIAPQNSDMLYASVFYPGTFGCTISKITDGGSSWTDITQIERKEVFSLASDPQTPATLYAGTSGGVYKSINSGATWNNSGLTGNIVYGLVIDQAGIIYAGTDGSGVFKSMDGGKSWYEINTGLTNKKVKALAIVQTKPITLYAATEGGSIFNITLPAVLGDVNDDGNVDLSDAMMALRIIAGIAGANEKINPNADVNGDKKIGIAEVVYILQVVAKIR
jgi:ligand-binding sensor domain-containing protein